MVQVDDDNKIDLWKEIGWQLPFIAKVHIGP